MFATARKKVVNVAFSSQVCVVYSPCFQILKCGLVFDNEDIKVEEGGPRCCGASC